METARQGDEARPVMVVLLVMVSPLSVLPVELSISILDKLIQAIASKKLLCVLHMFGDNLQSSYSWFACGGEDDRHRPGGVHHQPG